MEEVLKIEYDLFLPHLFCFFIHKYSAIRAMYPAYYKYRLEMTVTQLNIVYR
jgi:hypothetical protein